MLSAAVDEITRADIPAPTRTSALRLLQHVHPDNGHVAIMRDEACEACGVSWGTLRRHLGQLAKAHVIHYSTNGDGLVYCTFKAWIVRQPSKNSTLDARGRAPAVEKFDAACTDDSANDQAARVGEQESSKNSTLDARGRALKPPYLTRTSAHDLEGRKEYTTDDPSILPSFPPPATRQEAERSLRLLLAVKLAPKHARELAGLVAFTVIREHVAAWWMNRQSAGGPLYDGPGIVYRWLTDPHGAAPNAYVEADWRRTELYKLHRTPEEVAAVANGDQGDDEAERRRKYIPEEFSDIAIG